NIRAAMAAMALIVRISRLLRSVCTPRSSRFPALAAHSQTNTTRAKYARAVGADHNLRYCGIKGDQAGSEASVGVGTCRSKRPATSIALRLTDPARPPE